MTQRVKITISVEELYDYTYQDKTESRTREVELYMQKVDVSGLMGYDAAALVSAVANVANKTWVSTDH